MTIMDRFDVQLDFYLRALFAYIENPSPAAKMNYSSNEMYFRHVIREHIQQMEKQITENVLKAISIKLESGDALNEIKALKNAIDSLGK